MTPLTMADANLSNLATVILFLFLFIPAFPMERTFICILALLIHIKYSFTDNAPHNTDNDCNNQEINPGHR